MRLIYSVLAAMLLLAVTSAQAAVPISRVRVVHASANATNIDIYIDNAPTPTVANLGYRSASAAFTVSTGAHRVKITPSGVPSLTLLDTAFTVGNDSLYTAFALGSANTPIGVFLLQPLTITVPTGSALLRLVNGSPDLGTVNVKVTDRNGVFTTFNYLATGGYTPYATITGGLVVVEISDTSGQVRYRAQGTITSGTVNTIVMSGTFATLQFAMHFLYDDNTGAQSPLIPLTYLPPQGHLRLVNVTSGLPPVNGYIGNLPNPAFTNVNFRAASNVNTLNIGTQSLRVAQVSGGNVFTAFFNVASDSSYTVCAVGASGGGIPVVLSHPLGVTVPGGSADVRMLNSCTDLSAVDMRIRDASGADRLFTNVSYKAFTPFVRLPMGAIRVDVMRANGGPLIYRATGAVSSAQICTIIINGQVGVPGALGINQLTDNDTSAQDPLPLLAPTVAPTPLLRLVHLTIGSPAPDAYIDSGSVATFVSVGYRSATVNAPMGEGLHTVILTPNAQPGDTLLRQPITFHVDTAYTLVTIGDVAPVLGSVLLRRLQAATPTPGKAMLRFLHASGKLGKVTATLRSSTGGMVTIPNVLYPTASAYSEISAGTVTLELTDSNGVMIYKGRTTVPAGTVATVIAQGNLTPAPGTLAAHLLIDGENTGQSPMAQFSLLPVGTPNARVVHAVTGAPGLDIFLVPSTQPAITNLNYRDASQRLMVALGLQKYQATLAGTNVQVLYDSMLIGPDSIYTLLAMGSVATSTVTYARLGYPSALTPPAGKALVRVVHGSADAGTVDFVYKGPAASGFVLGKGKFGESSGFNTVEAGPFTVDITDNTGKLFYRGTRTAPANTIITLVVTGERTTVPSSFGVNVLTESDTSLQSPMPLLTQVADVYTPSAQPGMAGGATVYPNPAHHTAVVEYTVGHPGTLRLTLTDVLGREVPGLGPEQVQAGTQRFRLNLENVPPGLYTVSAVEGTGNRVTCGRLNVVR